jgi:SAM-dependent methyltransferase
LEGKQAFLDLVRRAVPDALRTGPGERKALVEIGIGPLAMGVCHLFEAPEQWDMTGVEPLPRRSASLPPILMACYEAMQSVPLRYVQARGEETGLSSDSFDLAICYNVIDHTPKWAEIIQEIMRLLKPRGFLLLGVDTLSLASKLRWQYFQRWVRPNDPYILAHPYRLTAQELLNLLPRFGFERVWVERHPKELARRLFGRARRLAIVGRKPEREVQSVPRPLANKI